MIRYAPAAALALILLVLLAMLWPRETVAPVAVRLPPAVEVREVEKVVVKVKYVKVYPDPVKDDLDLPADVEQDPAQKVISTAKLDAEERPYTLIGILDTKTGDASIYARPDPQPWLKPNTLSEVGAFIGYHNSAPSVRIEARQELLRIKAAHVGLIASADVGSELNTYVGAGVWMRW